MGASGSGKSTIQHTLPLPFLTHYVTRKPREGEIDGYHLKHISRTEFFELYELGAIQTKTEYADNFYGAPHSMLDDVRNGIPYHATATIDSIAQFRHFLGDGNVVVIYIKPPSIEALTSRMLARGDSQENIEKRIAHIFSANELANEEFADYVVINDSLEDAIAQVYTIIQTELKVDNLEQFKRVKEFMYEGSNSK
jgi:guanylate kinase